MSDETVTVDYCRCSYERDDGTTEPGEPCALHPKWIACRDRMPRIGQRVVLANANRMRAFDPLGCVKDVGVLWSITEGHVYWSTQGEGRGMCSDAFTHWMPLQEPPHE